jgi:hypothetical protein
MRLADGETAFAMVRRFPSWITATTTQIVEAAAIHAGRELAASEGAVPATANLWN